METFRVLGLDPSLTGTGWARDGDVEVAFGSISTKASDPCRLNSIFTAVEQRIFSASVTGAETKVDLAIVEDLPTHAHGAGLTGMAQGVVRLALQRHRVPYVVVPPASLKKYATGKGNATKADMRMALYQRTGMDVRDDNAVDAVWLRYLGLRYMLHPELEMPKAHLSVLDTLPLPVTYDDV